MVKKYYLEIKTNNCATNEPCAFCGNRTESQIPFAIFKYGTYSAVCYECVNKYNPEMEKTLSRINDFVNQYYHTEGNF